MSITLITPPDKIYNDAIGLLLLFPNKDLQAEIQQEIFPVVSDPLNVYLYDKEQYSVSDMDWLMSVFTLADMVLIDIDNCPPYVRDLASYMIAKPKTYWLTNSLDPVYNYISKNRIFNTSFLSSALGGISEEE